MAPDYGEAWHTDGLCTEKQDREGDLSFGRDHAARACMQKDVPTAPSVCACVAQGADQSMYLSVCG